MLTAFADAFTAASFGGFFDAFAGCLEAAGVPDPLLGLMMVLLYVGLAYAMAYTITRVGQV